MEFRTKLVEGVGAFIYARDTGCYLFLLRKGGSWPMTWALPGGKFNTGETDIDALGREIQEELGGRILDPELVKIDHYTSPNGKFKYHTYFIAVDKEFLPLLNNEHYGYAWLPLSAAPKPLHPGIVRTLKNQDVLGKIRSASSNL
jgi:8-oxo-dGTP pyrophosphatase MutT (NUDIX family)